MAKQNFTFGYDDFPLKDDGENIVLIGDPPHVVIPFVPIPSINIVGHNLTWNFRDVILKIIVNGVESEFIYDADYPDNNYVLTDLGTIYIEKPASNLVGWHISFKAFTIDKSARSCQISIFVENQCIESDTVPTLWGLKLSGVFASGVYTKDVYVCGGSSFHLIDMQIDTQTRTGWFELYEGVAPGKTCECGGSDDDDDDDDDEPNLPQTVYVTGKWKVTETLSDGTTYEEEGQLTPYSATLTVLGDGYYLYEGTGGVNNFVESRDNGETWTVSSDDNPHPKIMYPSVTKSGGPEGIYEYNYSEDVGGGTTVSEFIQFTVSALGVDEMFE